jgi:hypothetical protein
MIGGIAMALLKRIELDSGVVLNYHRIVSITKVTNHATVIEIAGYTSKEKRYLEIQQLADGTMVTAYIDTNFMSVDYDEETTIKDWYAYLKTTEKYNGAEDDD